MTRQHKPNVLLRILLLTLAAVIVLPALVAPARASLPSKTIKIGILNDLTGDNANEGLMEKRGTEQAVRQANVVLAAGTTGIQFTYAGLEVDSMTTGDGANQGYLNLVNTLGAQIIIGPCCSIGVKAIQSTGGTFSGGGLHVPIISPSSTAASLAIPNDYVFRAPGPDTVQATADALWVYNHGVRYVGEIARNDPYGSGLRDSFHTDFLALCTLHAVTCKVTVETYVTGFAGAASASATALDNDIKNLLNSTNANGDHSKVGVYAVAFETDGDEIYNTANSGTYSKTVNWYGSDGDLDIYFLTTPLSEQNFLKHVNYTGTNPVPPSPGPAAGAMANLWVNGSTVPKNGGGTIDLSAYGFQTLFGVSPYGDPYTGYAYDSAVLGMLAVLQANSYSGADIAAALTPATLSNQVGLKAVGATGLLQLNANGDRNAQGYVFWKFGNNQTSNTCCIFNVTTSQYYDSADGNIKSALPVGPEGTAKDWTSTLQDLAPTDTFAVPIFPNAWIALSTLFLAATSTLVLVRRRRI